MALEQADEVALALRTGVLRAGPGNTFTQAYFAHPDEVLPLVASAGFEALALVGCEGVVAGHEERVNALTRADWERWVDLNYSLCREPTLYGASDHLLAVGRKPDHITG